MTTAIGLAHGEGWPAGPHFMAPVYPFVLSGIFRIAPATVVTVQAFQLLLGVSTSLLIYFSARRIHPAAGLIAGLLYAACGAAIAYENMVLMESLLAFAIAGVIWIEDAPGRPWIRGLVMGLCIGIATAGRPTYVFLLSLLILPIIRRKPDTPPLPRNAFLLAGLLGFAIIVIPPSIRNTMETGRPSFVTTSGGLNLYIGNHPGASGIYSQPAGLFLEKDPTGTKSASRMAERSLSPAQASDYFASRAMEFLRGNPAAAARLVMRKFGYLLGPTEVPQIESMDELRRDHLSMRLFGLVGFPLLFPLGLLGAFRSASARALRRTCMIVLCSGALAHLIFFSTGRYRAAMLPALAILAGSGCLRRSPTSGIGADGRACGRFPWRSCFWPRTSDRSGRGEGLGSASERDPLREARGGPRGGGGVPQRAGCRLDPR